MAHREARHLTGRISLALGIVGLLAGCTMAPLGPANLPTAPATPAIPAPAPAPLDPTASGAEQACIAAGRERGLNVLGVVGSRSVSGVDGQSARDVMLRVERSGTQLEVRCNYVEDTRLARIMLI